VSAARGFYLCNLTSGLCTVVNFGHRKSTFEVLHSLLMRSDILPLCDQHYRTMELMLAPYNADRSIDFFRCTEKFCHRCFGERVGYVTPRRDVPPVLTPGPRLRLPRIRLSRARPSHLISEPGTGY
jgi:hypothetical protein